MKLISFDIGMKNLAFAVIEQKEVQSDKGPINVKNIINILFIAKSFERLADHAANIAEMVQYVVSGEIV